MEGFIKGLKDVKVVPKAKRTVFQALLIAAYSSQIAEKGNARKYFVIAMEKANAFTVKPTPAVQDLVADAAIFSFVAGNPDLRDVGKGERLLERIPHGNQSWSIRRARAAFNASKAAVAEGDCAAALGECCCGRLESVSPGVPAAA